jgi:hypothetical protein
MKFGIFYFLNVARFEFFTAVTMKKAVFWVVAPCSSYVNRRFGVSYCLQLQGRRICELNTAATCSRWFLARRFLNPEDWGNTILRNGGTTKKMVFCILECLLRCSQKSLLYISSNSACIEWSLFLSLFSYEGNYSSYCPRLKFQSYLPHAQLRGQFRKFGLYDVHSILGITFSCYHGNTSCPHSDKKESYEL